MIRQLPRRHSDTDADDLLRDMQIARYHMVAVTDGNQSIIGYLTMERILEEIVGEIADEHDREVDPVKTLGRGRYRVRGDLEVADVERILNVDLEAKNDEQTVAEYYQSLSGKRPTSEIRIGPTLVRPTKGGYMIQFSDEKEESPEDGG